MIYDYIIILIISIFVYEIIENMAAPSGNEYYKLRSKDGRDRIFKTPKALIDACNEYFEFCLSNPMKEAQIVKGNQVEVLETPSTNENGKAIKVKSKKTIPYAVVELPKMRPFTLEGLCNYINISLNTFKGYEGLEDFLIVTSRIRQIIDMQQFEGAAAGFLNPNIIARKLGLTDKSEVKVSQEQPLFGDD